MALLHAHVPITSLWLLTIRSWTEATRFPPPSGIPAISPEGTDMETNDP